jgi:hypothetical protein
MGYSCAPQPWHARATRSTGETCHDPTTTEARTTHVWLFAILNPPMKVRREVFVSRKATDSRSVPLGVTSAV